MVLSGTCTFMGSELAPRVPLSSDLERDPMDYVGKVFSLLSNQPQGKVKVKSLSTVTVCEAESRIAWQICECNWLCSMDEEEIGTQVGRSTPRVLPNI